MLTMVTEVFGVHGQIGDMVIRPKLLREQFDTERKAEIQLRFAEKDFQVIYKNVCSLSYGEYAIKAAYCNGNRMKFSADSAVLDREIIETLPDGIQKIEIELGRYCEK